MAISKWPDVLAEVHDSLNLFSAGEDSAELKEETDFLGPSFWRKKMINVQIRHEANRALLYSSLSALLVAIKIRINKASLFHLNSR